MSTIQEVLQLVINEIKRKQRLREEAQYLEFQDLCLDFESELLAKEADH